MTNTNTPTTDREWPTPADVDRVAGLIASGSYTAGDPAVCIAERLRWCALIRKLSEQRTGLLLELAALHETLEA